MTTFVYMNGHLTDIIVRSPRSPRSSPRSSPRPSPPPIPRVSRSPRPPRSPRSPPRNAPSRSRSWSHTSLHSEAGWRSDPGAGAGTGAAGVAHYLHPVVLHRPRPYPRPHHPPHPHPRRTSLRLHIQLQRPLARKARRKVQRLVKYEHERWQQGWQELRRSSQDDKEAERAAARGNHQPNGDLDRVQDMFPNDILMLYDDNPLALMSAKMTKSLMSRRNSPASKLSRALSTKTVSRTSSEDVPSPGSPGGSGGSGSSGDVASGSSGPTSPPEGEEEVPIPKLLRSFIMEAPAQFTTGVQGQERHLFLFSDLLLIAKPRGPGQFKLKDKVRVASLWLTAEPHAFHEVTELAKSMETSFVLGWPTTNVVATFSTQAARDLWWNKLSEAVAAETENEPKSTNIQVVFYDMDTNIEYCKTLCVRPADTVQGCIQMALEHLEMQALDPNHFQLWAKTPGDDSPYPLVAHERPFAIRMSCLRDNMNQEEGFDLDHCNNMYEPLDPRQRCQFILRNMNQMTELQKKKPKSRKSPMRLRTVFKRAKSEVNVDVESSTELGDQPKKGKKNKLLKQRRSNSSSNDVTDSATNLTALPSYLDDLPQGDLFGVPLQCLWRESCVQGATNGLVVDDVVGELAKPVMAMLGHVFTHGITTQGIFRRSANQRAVRELRRCLDNPDNPIGLWGDEDYEAATAIMEKSSVLTTSCLLKEFLRFLPVPLLIPDLCDDWLEAHHIPDHPGKDSVNPIKLQRYSAVVSQLPRCHRGLLAYILCLLHHIAAQKDVNLMGPHNLGVVLAPSLLRPPKDSPKELETILALSTPAIVGFLVENCQALFGPAVTKLLGEIPPPQDSGAEESDSLHSGGLDSLEHLEPCPPPRKDKMSLSRDSGLTMSDSQLFTPDEEESGSTSSSGSSRPANRYKMSKLAAGASTANVGAGPAGPSTGCRQYVRVYGGWEERRAGLYASSPRTAQLPSATSTGTGSPSPSGNSSTSSASHAGPSSATAGAGPSPFKREDWFRQRSALRRLASGGAGSPSSQNSYSPNYSPSSSPGPGPSPQGSSQGSMAIYGNLTGAGREHCGAEATSSPAAPSSTAPQQQQHQRCAANRRLDNGRHDRLRRSASEESLLERRGLGHLGLGHLGQVQPERPLPALPPQASAQVRHLQQHAQQQRLQQGLYAAPRMARSRSAYHLAPVQGAQRLSAFSGPGGADVDVDVYGYACVRGAARGASGSTGSMTADNSKSADESYDSSTLSDDDSTPHVSRSNSRSKEPGWSPALDSSPSAPATAPTAAPASAPPPPLPPKLRHLPPVHVELGATMERRGRSRRRLPKPAARSKSLPPPSQQAAPASPPPYRPPPYRPPPSVVPSHRAPITTYYLGARSNPNPAAQGPKSTLRAEEGESYV